VPTYSSGKHSFRECKCGYKVPYDTVTLEPQTGTYACAGCWDPDFRKRRKVPVDSTALRNPRPQNDVENKTVTPRRVNPETGERYLLAFNMSSYLGCCIAINSVAIEESQVATMSLGQQLVLPGYVIANQAPGITSALGTIAAVDSANPVSTQVMTMSLGEVIVGGYNNYAFSEGTWGHA